MSDQSRPRVTNQVFGLFLLTAFGTVFIFVTLLFLSPTEAVGAAVFAAVTGAVTYLVWRFDKVWAIVLGLVVTLAILALSFFTVFGIFHIFSPLEFITSLLFLFGALFALIGGVQALLSRRRETEPGTTGRRMRAATLTVIGLASAISIVGFLFTRETVSAAEAEGATVVDMEKFEFVPGDVIVASGGKLLVANRDPFAHDFTLEAGDIYVYYTSGGESLVDLSGLAPGEYVFFCDLHTVDGEGMTGTLTVEG